MQTQISLLIEKEQLTDICFCTMLDKMENFKAFKLDFFVGFDRNVQFEQKVDQ